MADFAPELKDPPLEDYTRLSRGWQDDGIATGITGAAQVFKAGVQVVDERNKREIKFEAQRDVDETRDRSIAELHSLSRPTGDTPGSAKPIPSEIGRDAEKLALMKQAVNQGSFRESNYWGVLDSTARKLRAKYPGYRDHIDDTMKQLTGSDPANALIRELRQDAAELLRAGKDPESKRLELVKTMSGEGTLPPNWRDIPTDRLLDYRADQNRVKYTLESRQRLLSTTKTSKDFDRDEAGTIAGADFGGVMRQFVQGTGSSIINKDVKQLEAIRQQWESTDPSKPRDPKQTAEFVALTGRVANHLEGEFVKWSITKRDFLPNGASYAEYLGADKIKAIKETQLDHIVNLYKKAAVDKDFGALKHASQLVEVFGDVTKAEMFQDKFITTVKTMREVLGDNGFGIVMNRDARVLNAVQETFKQYALTAIADPTGRPTSLLEKAQEITTVGGKQAANKYTLKALVDKSAQLVSDDAMPAPSKAKLIDSMYGQGNETFLAFINKGNAAGGSPRAPQEVFNTMANPATARAVKKFSDTTGDPSHWEKYQSWVIKQTYAMNLSDINLVSKAMTDYPAVNIKFNPQSFRFDVSDRDVPSSVPGSQSPGMAVLRTLGDAYDRTGTGPVKEAVEQVNRTFQPLRDIVVVNGEKDPSAFALSVLTNMSLLAESQYGKDTVQKSVLNALGKALYEQTWDPSKVAKPGPYVAPKADAPPAQPYDMTPVAFEKLGERVSQFGRWFSSKMPSRENIDKIRNQDRMKRGE